MGTNDSLECQKQTRVQITSIAPFEHTDELGAATPCNAHVTTQTDQGCDQVYGPLSAGTTASLSPSGEKNGWKEKVLPPIKEVYFDAVSSTPMSAPIQKWSISMQCPASRCPHLSNCYRTVLAGRCTQCAFLKARHWIGNRRAKSACIIHTWQNPRVMAASLWGSTDLKERHRTWESNGQQEPEFPHAFGLGLWVGGMSRVGVRG